MPHSLRLKYRFEGLTLRSPLSEIPVADLSTPSVEKTVIECEGYRVLLDGLRRLSSNEREVLIVIVVDGRPQEELSPALRRKPAEEIELIAMSACTQMREHYTRGGTKKRSRSVTFLTVVK